MNEWEVREIVKKVKEEDTSGTGCAILVWMIVLILLTVCLAIGSREWRQVKEDVKELQIIVKEKE